MPGKILHLFFTTKPTGEGTEPRLSLNCGSAKAESREGTAFIN